MLRKGFPGVKCTAAAEPCASAEDNLSTEHM